MRTLCIILTIIMARSLAFSAETNALLFFAVSETPIIGGRYIDTAEFPKLGYISNAPNFVLSRLQAVSTNYVTPILRGNKEVMSTNITPEVLMTMFPTDRKMFAAFTRQHVGRKILLMLGGRPLMAPIVSAPIETGSFKLANREGRLPWSVVEEIRKLARHE